MRSFRCTALAAALTLLALPATGADSTYTLQPIVRAGDKVGDFLITKTGYLYASALNDKGQLLFSAENGPGDDALIQCADGKLTSIATSGGDAPDGKWPDKLFIRWGPKCMNQSGNVVFAAGRADGSGLVTPGTYRWDYTTQRVTAVALPGMPAVQNLTIVRGGGLGSAINNQDEIALVATVKNTAGQERSAVFFRGRDGQLRPVALPDQVLPDGQAVREAYITSITDEGTVMFEEAAQEAYYLWEQDATTRVIGKGQAIPGGKTVARLAGHFLNNRNRTVLLALHLNDRPDRAGLYRSAQGRLTPLAVPGQEMPGGGRLRTIRLLVPGVAYFGVSMPNEAGQHAFLAQLEGGSTAAYLLDADGTLSLILKSGTTTAQGTITDVGGGNWLGVGLNTKGQIVLPVRIDRGVNALVLLTPTSP